MTLRPRWLLVCMLALLPHVLAACVGDSPRSVRAKIQAGKF